MSGLRLTRAVCFVCAGLLAADIVMADSFEEGPWSGIATIDPNGSVHAVAIYACAFGADSTFQGWFTEVWDSCVDHSVPKYYLDNSFHNHYLSGDPYGQPHGVDTFCFVSHPYVGIAVGDSGALLISHDLNDYQLNSSGTGACLRGLACTEAFTEIAVGDSGVALGTTDGGRSWTREDSRTTHNLYGVSLLAGERGFAVGDFGTIIRRMGGTLWYSDSFYTHVSSCLRGVSCFQHGSGNTDYGVAVGDIGTVMRKDGAAWDTIHQRRTTHDLRDVCFLDTCRGVAVGDSGTILWTENGGMDWDTATSHTYSNLYGIYFPVLRNWNYVVSVSDTGFAVGESRTILKTEDAGRSWTVVDSGGAYALHAVYFAVYDTGSGYGKERDTVVSDTGIAVGESGTILRTTDGGDTWDSVVCETGRDLHDVVTTNVIREYNWLGHDFTWDILLKADEIINFADYDRDGDDTVDMLFLIDPTRGGTSYGGLALEHWFTTNDTSSSGRPIRILSNANSPSATVLAPNRNGVVAVCVHEYAHSLGLDDYYDFRRPTAGRGIGGFEAMSDCSGFKGIVSPFNPWFRSKHGGNHGPFNWLDLIPVTRPQYGQPIQDITTGEAYEVVSGPYPETATSGQRFLVTNHQGLSFWEQNWPRTGLMIWHIDPEAKILSGGDSRYKKVDLEAPHGLWDWDFEEWTPTFPNPVLGIDSLDVADADTAWRSKFDGFGSPTCMFRVGIDSTFDALTNPSSDNYNSDSSLFAAHSQNVASHVAVKNMYLDTIYPTIVHADLLPNWVESDRVVATAENNGRRWLLGPDEQAMHLVYVSKGYIYYTTTDSSKLWLPAVPIGEGSYPSLGLDTSGDPCVVWIQQGDCSTTNAKLLFSRKTNGSWTSPVTLLSIFAGLGPPSLVVDNGDTSSRCLYGRVMYPHTVAQHLHILRAIQDHRSELHADVAGRF